MDAAMTVCETPGDLLWLPTLLYPETYRVTEAGDVKSIERELPDSRWRMRHYREHVLTPWFHAAGYPMVALSGGRKGERRTVCVHVLVKEAFHGRTPPGQEVLHDDGNPTNCHLSNLVFGTSAQNKADIARHGRNYWSNRTVCDYGHLLDGVNVVRNPSEPGRRRCVSCHRARGIVDHERRHGRTADFREVADRKYLELTGLAPTSHRRQASTRLVRTARPSDPVPDLPGERWLPVVGWEDSYMVSHLARVKGLGRWRPWRGQDDRFVPERLLTPTPDRNGYPVVGVSDRSRKSGGRLLMVHLLVARAFLGVTPVGEEVLHGDGDAGNAALSNLRFGTHAENGQDMVRHGRTPRDRQGDTCRWGHALAAPNLVERHLPARKCLACRRAWVAEATARKRGEALDHQETSDRKYREIMGEEKSAPPKRAETCIRNHLLVAVNLIPSRATPACLACNRARGLVRHHAGRGVTMDLDALADEKYREIMERAGQGASVPLGVGTAL